jgi:protein KRI1
LGLDLDADWDPEAHDKQMADLYADDEGVGDVDAEKPEWEDDIDIDDIMPPEPSSTQTKEKKKKKKKKKKAEADGDAGGVDVDRMDADKAPLEEEEEEWDGTEEMRKRKLEEYMDEVYGLDFNDMVPIPLLRLTLPPRLTPFPKTRQQACPPDSNMPLCNLSPSR